jgi:hypothetical protein
MKSAFEYRSYCLDKDGAFYTAKPVDGDELTLRSTCLISIMRGVDTLWDATDVVRSKASVENLPVWIKNWLKKRSSLIDLDLAYGAAPRGEPARILHFPKGSLAIVARAAADVGGAAVGSAALFTLPPLFAAFVPAIDFLA